MRVMRSCYSRIHKVATTDIYPFHLYKSRERPHKYGLYYKITRKSILIDDNPSNPILSRHGLERQQLEADVTMVLWQHQSFVYHTMIIVSVLQMTAMHRRVAGSTLARIFTTKSLQSEAVFDRQKRRPFCATTSQSRYFWFLRGGGRASKQDSDTSATVDVAQNRPAPEPLLNSFPVSACSVRGFRGYMEDDFVCAPDFAAVFDGHGGKAVSRYLRQNLYAELQAALPRVMGAQISETTKTTDGAGHDSTSSISSENHTITTTISHKRTELEDLKVGPTIGQYEEALCQALYKVDSNIQRISHWSFQGSTAVAVWMHEEKMPSPSGKEFCNTLSDPMMVQSKRTIIAANIGDSRAILSRNETAIELTRDHKPSDPIELDRIHSLGGRVIWHGHVDTHGDPIPGTGVYRVNGNLALSRAIGDRSERPAVTADPDVSILPIDEADDFLVLATDGLWDVMTSSDVVAFIHALIEQGEDIDRDPIAAMVVEEAIRRGSYDNITVLIVWLNPSATSL
jgi:protein phosphatase 1L